MGARFIVLAVVCVALMIVDQRASQLDRVRQALAVVVSPLQLLVDLPFRAWSTASSQLTGRDELFAENERLSRELLNAQFDIQRLARLEAENEQLRELVGSSGRIGRRTLIAEVLNVDIEGRQRFVLNRGERDGVYVGQALLDAKGVVGQVVRVLPGTSEAMLITDADHALPVVVQRNQLSTIAVGTGDYGRLRLRNLTSNSDIEVGDLLVSSGLGGLFPKGHPVATVTAINERTDRPNQAFAEVIAEPLSTLDLDREMLLVWDAAPDAAPAGDAPGPEPLLEAAPVGEQVAGSVAAGTSERVSPLATPATPAARAAAVANANANED